MDSFRFILSVFVVVLTLGASTAVAEDAASVGLGAKVYAENCGRCHEAPDPASRDGRQWNAIVVHMRVISDLSRADQQRVVAFLRAANSAAMKREGDASASKAPPDSPSPRDPQETSQAPNAMHVGCPFTVQASTGKAPSPESSKVNPVSDGATERKEGRALYSQSCAICHGPSGKGDGVSGTYLSPKPTDFTDPSFSSQDDGTLFAKLTNGQNAMPPFQSMSEQQRWKIIRYLRSLSPKPVPSTDSTKVLPAPSGDANIPSAPVEQTPIETPTEAPTVLPAVAEPTPDATPVVTEPAAVRDDARTVHPAPGPAWPVPATESAKPNPVPDTSAARSEGARLYSQVCASCHGVSGRGDGPSGLSLKPKPSDFTDPLSLKQSDGDLFWKLSTGRTGMPAFKGMPEPQRWTIVHYLRTLAESPTPSASERLEIPADLLKAAELDDLKAAEQWWSSTLKPGDDIAARYIIMLVLPMYVAPVPAEDVRFDKIIKKLCFEVLDRNSAPGVWRGVAEMAALMEAKHFDMKSASSGLSKGEALQSLTARFTYNTLMESEPVKKAGP